jgi:hypothetical protein
MCVAKPSVDGSCRRCSMWLRSVAQSSKAGSEVAAARCQRTKAGSEVAAAMPEGEGDRSDRWLPSGSGWLRVSIVAEPHAGELNRAHWDALARIHGQDAYYDADALIAGGDSLAAATAAASCGHRRGAGAWSGIEASRLGLPLPRGELQLPRRDAGGRLRAATGGIAGVRLPGRARGA